MVLFTRTRALVVVAVLVALAAVAVTVTSLTDDSSRSGALPVPGAPVPGVSRHDFRFVDGKRVVAFWSPKDLRSSPADSRPWVAYVHGGGWVRGAVDEPTAVAFCQRMVTIGITCFSLDYTLTPKAYWPVQGNQVSDELAWVRRHGAAFHLDPALGFAVGHSAGGLMAGVAGLGDNHLAGVVSLAGATNAAFVAEHNDDRNVARFAHLLLRDGSLDDAYARSASVIGHVTPDTARVPYLLVQERDDPAVSVQTSYLLARQLRADGFPVTLDVFAGHTHQVNVSGPGVPAVDQWLLARIADVRAARPDDPAADS